jgi:hypothetical protein
VTALAAVAALLLGGCSPIKCLFPLYSDSDKLFDGNLIGEWRTAPDKNQKDEGTGAMKMSAGFFRRLRTTYRMTAHR